LRVCELAGLALRGHALRSARRYPANGLPPRLPRLLDLAPAELAGNHFATSNFDPSVLQKLALTDELHDGQGFTVSPYSTFVLVTNTKRSPPHESHRISTDALTSGVFFSPRGCQSALSKSLIA